MKILVISQYFYPENFRINDFAFKMVKRGHDVTVLTGLPNYPNGRLFGKYKLFTNEVINGVKICRVPLIPRGNSKKIALFLNYVSFLFSSLFFGFFKIWKESPDLIFSVNYSPPTASLIGYLYSRLFSAPLFVWVQDLWPESLTATGTVKSKRIIVWVKKVMTFLYNQTECILVQSKSFSSQIEDSITDRNKIFYFPNWAEDVYEKNQSGEKNQFSHLVPKDKFIIMFAGNLGVAQSLETIIEAANKVKEYPIHWIFVGDGRQSEWLKNCIAERKLNNNISMLGRYPIEAMSDFFDLADVMLVTLKKDPALNLTIPGKIQSYLKNGKPILSALDGEGASVVNESGAGFNTSSENIDGLAENAIKISKMSAKELQQMSESAKEYYSNNFESMHLLSKFEKIVKNNRAKDKNVQM